MLLKWIVINYKIIFTVRALQEERHISSELLMVGTDSVVTLQVLW